MRGAQEFATRRMGLPVLSGEWLSGKSVHNSVGSGFCGFLNSDISRLGAKVYENYMLDLNVLMNATTNFPDTSGCTVTGIKTLPRNTRPQRNAILANS